MIMTDLGKSPDGHKKFLFKFAIHSIFVIPIVTIYLLFDSYRYENNSLLTTVNPPSPINH